MATNYEKGFIIEYINTGKKRISCKDCIYYEKTDQSCNKKGLYLPIDGYDSWKHCDHCELDSTVNHLEEKTASLKKNTMLDTSHVKESGIGKSEKEDQRVVYISCSDIILPHRFKYSTPNNELLNSIDKFYQSKHELQKPILVKKQNKRYELLDGFSRYYYAKSIKNLDKIPALIEGEYAKKYYSFCKKGRFLIHKSKGSGKVVNFDLQTISLIFPGHSGIMKFSIDICIKQGLLKRH